MGVIYTCGRMNNSSESAESVAALDENLVRADSPDSNHPSLPIRLGRFADMLYAVEGIMSTLSKSRLDGFHGVYQIPESVNLRVPSFDEWA